MSDYWPGPIEPIEIELERRIEGFRFRRVELQGFIEEQEAVIKSYKAAMARCDEGIAQAESVLEAVRLAKTPA